MCPPPVPPLNLPEIVSRHNLCFPAIRASSTRPIWLADADVYVTEVGYGIFSILLYQESRAPTYDEFAVRALWLFPCTLRIWRASGVQTSAYYPYYPHWPTDHPGSSALVLRSFQYCRLLHIAKPYLI